MTAPKQLRAENVEAVLGALRAHGRLSRTELADVTGLSRTTVISIVDELAGGRHVAIDGGGSGRQSLGRPAAEVCLDVGAGVVVGVAVDGGAVDVVVSDLSQTHVARRQASGASARIAAAVDDALAELGVARDRVLGAGVAVDGAPARAVERVLASFGVTVVADDPARLEALAECTLGAGRGLSHLVYVHAGTTLHAGVMVGGRLRVGPTASAGAIGAVPVGARDTLAGVASGEALVRALQPLHGEDLDLDRLVALARSGDAAARRAIADAGDQLGAVVASLCTALNPDAVILGGVLAGEDLPLVDRVRERVATPKLRDTGPIALHRAVLGRDAAALGAASAAARAVEPRPPA